MENRFNPPFFRESYCWDRKEYINNTSAPECPACGWIICPYCGACRQFGCVSVESIDRRHRPTLRELWISLPEPRPESVETWAIDTVTEINENERLEAERQRFLIKEKYRKRLTFGVKIYHPLYGNGRIVKLTIENGKEKVIARFSNFGEKRFYFPDSFLSGGLRFEDKQE